MKSSRIQSILPSWKGALLAILSAILLILAFPDFEYWFLAWFALVPLLLAVEREKVSLVRSFITGWLFGIVFFFGTCWWLAYAPIHYAGFPPILAYFLVFCGTTAAATFLGIFTLIISILLRRFGAWAVLLAPFIWSTTEFLRFWLTGNNWNAIAYSQAFALQTFGPRVAQSAAVGGVYYAGSSIIFGQAFLTFLYLGWRKLSNTESGSNRFLMIWFATLGIFGFLSKRVRERAREIDANGGVDQRLALLYVLLFFGTIFLNNFLNDATRVSYGTQEKRTVSNVVAVQPNVPMSGLNYDIWRRLRQHQIEQAESALRTLPTDNRTRTTVILPESPMNFQWGEDLEFQQFISQFAAKNNVNVLFNSAEPDRENNKYFNSAVMIDASGREVAEYDKIYLLPFGEAVPVPLESLVPAFVGSFSYGKNYNFVPLGDAKAGIMICFESHFGQLSREYVRRGADAVIEMTNDGYLGPTPVLRQHLANAVFRAIETNRPVLRVTNVGITAYITERGEILDTTQPYTEDTRIWTVEKSDGSQTFYVRYGDWFAWLCSVITIALLVFSFIKRKPAT